MLVSGATQSVEKHDVGVLIVPRAWNLVEHLSLQPGRWAMDNGAFAGFDEGAFVRMLERFSDATGCLFVVAPDVVGDGAATLRRWPFWARLIRGLGYPVAFVAQDGITPEAVPWDADTLFIGGTTAFKESAAAGTLCGIAKARGLWVHVGRVNSKRRLAIVSKFGADSYDGTGFSMMPDVNIPKGLRWDKDITTLERTQVQLL